MPENPKRNTDVTGMDSPFQTRSGWLGRAIRWAALLVAGLVLVALLLPSGSRSRLPTKRTQCKNNLKQIGLALHMYHDTWHTFPPAFTVDAEGRPLHSWRVLLLPYLDQQDIYNKIDLTKPWDDPVHAEVRKTRILVYTCPSNPDPKPHTSYVAAVGDDDAFTGAHPLSLSDFTDGTSNTLMVMEVSRKSAIEWMDPHDGDEESYLSAEKSQTFHMGGFQAVFADGSVRFVSVDTPLETRRALLTRSGGERVIDF